MRCLSQKRMSELWRLSASEVARLVTDAQKCRPEARGTPLAPIDPRN
jgi:hypothetical protein